MPGGLGLPPGSVPLASPDHIPALCFKPAQKRGGDELNVDDFLYIRGSLKTTCTNVGSVLS